MEVRGCFWHQHASTDCKNSKLPRSRREWWTAKLNRNAERDRENQAALEAMGWQVLVIWECETKTDANALASRLVEFLGPPGPMDIRR